MRLFLPCECIKNEVCTALLVLLVLGKPVLSYLIWGDFMLELQTPVLWGVFTFPLG